MFRTHRVNTFIDAKKRAYSKWWNRNKKTLHDLIIKGNSISVVAKEHSRTTRTVREVRDTFLDIKRSMTQSEQTLAMKDLRAAWTDT